jgi:phosphoglycolate phosphatase-like HAD superfamily hydrolase
VERGARRLGRPLRRDEVLVIGDTPFDVDCGRATGARVLAVATGGATREALAAHRPDWLVDDLTAVNARAVCT